MAEDIKRTLEPYKTFLSLLRKMGRKDPAVREQRDKFLEYYQALPAGERPIVLEQIVEVYRNFDPPLPLSDEDDQNAPFYGFNTRAYVYRGPLPPEPPLSSA